MLMVVALTLPACAALTKSNNFVVTPPKKPIIQEADSSLTEGCARPVYLGEGDLNQAKVEKLWSTDRANLVRCGDRHSAHVDFIKDRDAKLTNGK